MSRIYEGIFVLGCSLVGFSQSFADSAAVHDAARFAVRMVTVTQANLETKMTGLATNLSEAPVRALPACWR